MTKSCLLWLSMTWNPWVVFIFVFESFPLAMRSVLEYGEMCRWTLSRTKGLCPPKNACVETLTLTVLTRAARYLGDNCILRAEPWPCDVCSCLQYQRAINSLSSFCWLSYKEMPADYNAEDWPQQNPTVTSTLSVSESVREKRLLFPCSSIQGGMSQRPP